MHDHAILGLGVILLVASLVAMLSRLAHLPYSVGLVLAGIALPFMQTGLDFRLTRDLIFEVLLPPLVFEAALQLRWRPFRDALPVTLMLAFAGVAIATAVVTGALHLLLGWSWIAAGLFGVLIAATDPVAVIAAFKELHVVPRLGMLVESESLLNDGAAAVGFGILLAVQGGDASRRRRGRRLAAVDRPGRCRRGRRGGRWRAAAGRPHGRSSGRDHADHDRRLRVLHTGRASPDVRRARDGDGGSAGRQRRPAWRHLRGDQGMAVRFLGVRGVPGELRGVHPDRRAGRQASGFPVSPRMR